MSARRFVYRTGAACATVALTLTSASGMGTAQAADAVAPTTTVSNAHSLITGGADAGEGNGTATTDTEASTEPADEGAAEDTSAPTEGSEPAADSEAPAEDSGETTEPSEDAGTAEGADKPADSNAEKPVYGHKPGQPAYGITLPDDTKMETADGEEVIHPCVGRKIGYHGHFDSLYGTVDYNNDNELVVGAVDGQQVVPQESLCFRLAPDADKNGKELSRFVVPDDPNYAFLGKPGDVVWIAPKNVAAFDGFRPIWAGLGAFDPTHEPKGADSIPKNFKDDNFKFTLTDFSGPGDVDLFFDNATTPPDHIFSTRDEKKETIDYKVGAHGHFNWTFTQPGIYYMTWQGSAVDKKSGEEITTKPVEQIWLVGPDGAVGLPEGTTDQLNEIKETVDGKPIPWVDAENTDDAAVNEDNAEGEDNSNGGTAEPNKKGKLPNGIPGFTWTGADASGDTTNTTSIDGDNNSVVNVGNVINIIVGKLPGFGRGDEDEDSGSGNGNGSGNDSKGDDSKGDSSKGDDSKGEDSKGDSSKGEDSKPEVTLSDEEIKTCVADQSITDAWAVTGDTPPAHRIDEGHMDQALVSKDGKFHTELIQDGKPVESGTYYMTAQQNAQFNDENALAKVREVLGNDVENPFWVLPQAQKPGIPWLGFSNTEVDSALLNPDNPLTVSIKNFTAPEGGRMVTWHEGLSGIDLVLDSNDTSKTLKYPPNAHDHQAFMFTKPGAYSVTFNYQVTAADGTKVDEDLISTFYVDEETIKMAEARAGGDNSATEGIDCAQLDGTSSPSTGGTGNQGGDDSQGDGNQGSGNQGGSTATSSGSKRVDPIALQKEIRGFTTAMEGLNKETDKFLKQIGFKKDAPKSAPKAAAPKNASNAQPAAQDRSAAQNNGNAGGGASNAGASNGGASNGGASNAGASTGGGATSGGASAGAQSAASKPAAKPISTSGGSSSGGGGASKPASSGKGMAPAGTPVKKSADGKSKGAKPAAAKSAGAKPTKAKGAKPAGANSGGGISGGIAGLKNGQATDASYDQQAANKPQNNWWAGLAFGMGIMGLIGAIVFFFQASRSLTESRNRLDNNEK